MRSVEDTSKTENNVEQSTSTPKIVEMARATPEGFLELVTTPEAKDLLTENKHSFYEQLDQFLRGLDAYAELDDTDRYALVESIRRIAGALTFGGSTAREFGHVGTDVEEYLKQNYNAYDATRQSQTLRTAIEQEGSTFIIEQGTGIVRREKQAEASLFALGITQEDIEAFSRVREKLAQVVGKDYMMSVPMPEDFSRVRRQAYKESRETSQSLFVHATSFDSLDYILRDRSFKAQSVLVKEGKLDWTKRGGQNPNPLQEIYFLRNSVATHFSSEKAREAGEVEGEDFAALALLGADALGNGYSIDVADTQIFGEEARYSGEGAKLAQFDQDIGTEAPIEMFNLLISEPRVEKTKETLLELGYEEEWIRSHVTVVPSKILGAERQYWAQYGGQSTIENDRERFRIESKSPMNQWILSTRHNILGKSSYKDKLFATVESRPASDDPDTPNSRVHRWLEVGSTAS